jgi:hypothetical protein
MMQNRPLPDRLSNWELPPVSDAAPVRVFDSAEQALAFLAVMEGVGKLPTRAATAPFDPDH